MRVNRLKANMVCVGREDNLAGGASPASGLYIGDVATGIALQDVTTGFSVQTATTGLNLAGAMTTGILIAGATTNAISITGASATAQINLAHTLAAADDRCIKIVSSSASTSASTSQAYIHCTHTMSGAGSVGGRAEFNTVTGAIALGGWSNAIKGNFNATSATGGTGLHSSVCAEMTVPNATVSGGYFAPLEIELNIPASHVPQTGQLSMIYMSPNTTPATFDSYGTVFELAGVTAANGKVFDSIADVAADHSLRIRVAGTFYYILLAAAVTHA